MKKELSRELEKCEAIYPDGLHFLTSDIVAEYLLENYRLIPLKNIKHCYEGELTKDGHIGSNNWLEILSYAEGYARLFIEEEKCD